MDEPFAAVDAATEKAIVENLRNHADGWLKVCCHPSRPSHCAGLFRFRRAAEYASRRQRSNVDVFTRENLGKTYGGRLTLLDEATEAICVVGSVRCERTPCERHCECHGRDFVVSVARILQHRCCGDRHTAAGIGRRDRWLFHSASTTSLMGDALSHAALPGVGLGFCWLRGSVWTANLFRCF